MNRNIAIILSANDAPLRHVLSGAAGYINAFEKSVESANTRMSAFGTVVKAIATAGILALGVALGYAAVQAISFEKEMRNVNTVAHESEAGLKRMSAAVLELSTELPQSATTLAKGLYDVASSGFYGADALEVLEVSARAASAGITETNVASKAIVGVLNAYGLSAGDAADVSDVLFKTVELGVLTFEDLATQLGDVIGAASAAKVPIDEVGSAIAAMTLSGLSAAESTVSLNRLLQKLIKPGKELSDTLHNLGYESGAAALEEDGLHGVMEKLRLATGGQITELIRLFPEIRAARGAFALMANEGENYQRVFDGITDKTARAGATQRAFNEQMKAFGNQFTLFKNQVNAVAIEVGTAMIPALRNALDTLTDFGQAVGRVISDIGNRARPGIEAMIEVFEKLADIGRTVGSVLGPALRGLAGVLGAGLIGGFNALASVLADVLGWVAKNETALKIFATLIGGILVSKLAQAVGGFIAFQAQFKALLVMESLGGVITTITNRIGLLGSAFMNIAMVGGNVGTGLGQIRGAFAGLAGVLTSPVFLGTLVFAGFTAFMVGAQNAERQAKELRKELESDIDFTSLDSINEGLDSIAAEFEKANQAATDYRSVGGAFKFVAETLTPMENGLQDAAAAADELKSAYNDAQQPPINVEVAQEQLMSRFGITENAARSLLETLEFDPRTVTGDFWLSDLIDAADRLKARADNASPAALAMADALEQVGGVASTAADHVEALKNAMDGLLGIAINAREAEANLAEAIQGLTDSVTENGLTFDIWTEAGRNNEQALRDNITAIIDLANATAEETGSVEAGVNQLQLYREQLISNLTQMGMTREGAEALLATYGLTPENLETLITLKGMDAAQYQLDVFDTTMEKINDAKINPIVTLDDVQFINDVDAVGNMLLAIEEANPEAEVYLNGENFHPQAAMVMQWIQTYGEQSPEAQALLNILDPENKFTSLQGLLNYWNASSGTADANAQDNASPVISNVEDKLNAIDGMRSTVYVDVVQRGSVILPGSRNVPMRWGGIVPARTGLLWEAQTFSQPTVFAGERETGGEAFIPRLGNRHRSLSILNQAAGWYGMGIHPMGSNFGDISVNNSVNISVGEGANTSQINRDVKKAMDKSTQEMLKQLRQELVAR